MGTKPQNVGDLPTFKITLTPPDTAPTAVASAVHVTVRKPDGSEFNDDAGVSSAGVNQFVYVATARIDAPNTWRWRIISNSGIVDALEVGVTIPKPAFTTPLP